MYGSTIAIGENKRELMWHTRGEKCPRIGMAALYAT
jgi:hypothetical protein